MEGGIETIILVINYLIVLEKSPFATRLGSLLLLFLDSNSSTVIIVLDPKRDTCPADRDESPADDYRSRALFTLHISTARMDETASDKPTLLLKKEI